ncbi:nucleolar protein 10-like [Pistacia vera]|uniref:nucleolar protein 10-like n=1 Tax=Pistacia vera TaxID=55513 RepID=UPI001262D017|nr:nucleolar protein 10-like [Pistacia vera]
MVLMKVFAPNVHCSEMHFGFDEEMGRKESIVHMIKNDSISILFVSPEIVILLYFPSLQEVTALQFDTDGGFQMGVGSSTGKVLLYDLQSSYPIRIKDHMYGSPILDIQWHHSLNTERPKLITIDSKMAGVRSTHPTKVRPLGQPPSVPVRIVGARQGEGRTPIEPSGGKINDICVFKDSGLVLLALASSQVPAYFIPDLGTSPKWCAPMENMTEELEEGGQTTIYDNYKFFTREDLEKLNLTSLIGTNLLRAYMHGFFIDYRLYKKAKAIADPFAYETHKEEQKQRKLEEQRASRITLKRKLPNVNCGLAARILENEEAEDESKDVDDNETKKKSKKKKGLGSDVFKDERFVAMFEIKQSEAFWNRVSLAKEDALPMGERLKALQNDRQASGLPSDVKLGPGGWREISFITRNSTKYEEDKEDKEAHHVKRRGIQSLGLKTR